MEFLIVLFVLALAAVVIAFTVRVKVLKRSFREIAFGMEEKMREESNTPLRAPSADKDVAKLVSYLNAQVDGAIAAKRQYEDADSELKRAVTNVSHDLRTPLTSAAGYLNLLQGSGLNEKQAAYARIVAGRIEAMKKLTEELFAYSVVAAEEEAFELRPLCLNDCLEDSLVQFFVAFAERGIEPKIDICAERVERKSNRDALARIFGNIVGNAVRYSGGDFAVTLTPDGKIVFENAAPQLDEVSTMKLFDRFFTVENARGSTGLGLSIAKVLTERLGGSICASWREGRLYIELRF